MRHRRHALIPPHTRTLRATAATPCVAALLVALLTGAAPGSGTGAEAGSGGEARAAAVGTRAGTHIGTHTATAVKSPAGHGTSRTRPSPSTAPAEAGADSETIGEHDLYEDDPGYEPLEYDYAPSTGERPTTAATGGVSPVLPLGAGMTLIGLGLALIALRLRRA